MSLWLITIPLIAPFLVLRAGIDDFEEVQEFLWPLWSTYNRFFLLIILYNFIFKKKRFPKGISFFMYPWLALCVFLIFHNIFTHFDLSTIYQNTIGALYAASPVALFLIDKKTRPSLNQIYITILIILLVQLIWLPLNMDGIFAYMSRYQELIHNSDEASLMPGTFPRSNSMADFVSIAFLFVYIDFFARHQLPKWQFVVVSIVVVVLLLFAGSKLPIVCTIISFILSAVIYSKKGVLMTIFAFVLGLSFFIFLSNTSEKVSENEGANRIVNGLSSFTKAKKTGKEDTSTFSLTGKLIDKYFMESPLWGCGNSYKGNDNAYKVNYPVSDLTTIRADATFAYYLVEFGLIGISFLLFYYYSIIRYACLLLPSKLHRISFVIFVFFLLFSMTEGGLFITSNYPYIFTYLFALQRYYEEHERHNT